MVGSANGRSMTALTSDLPRNSSRTRTQAVTVPSTALRTTTTNAVPKVSFSADWASGLETICQNACSPPLCDSQRSAAIGRTTITSRYVVITPTDRAVLPRPPAAIRRAGAAAGAATALMGRASHGALDPDHPALDRVEPDAVHLPPAAEEPVLDAEGRAGVVLLAPAREVGPLQNRLHDRPVAVGGEDPLLLRRMGVLDERLRGRGRALQRHHRQLDQHRRLRDDELPLFTGGEGRVRLALVGDQNVALAGEERVRGGRPGRILRHDVLEELRHELSRLVVAQPGLARLAVRREDIPLRRARAERVRRHDLDARLDEVLPAVDVLRVAR